MTTKNDVWFTNTIQQFDQSWHKGPLAMIPTIMLVQNKSNLIWYFTKCLFYVLALIELRVAIFKKKCLNLEIIHNYLFGQVVNVTVHLRNPKALLCAILSIQTGLI